MIWAQGSESYQSDTVGLIYKSSPAKFPLFEDFSIESIKLPKEFVAQIKKIPFLRHGFVKRLRFPKSSLFTYVIGI